MTKKDYRNFAWIVGGMAALLFGLILPWLSGHSPRWMIVALGAFFAALGTVAPGSLRPVYKIWMAVGHFLGRINSFILLHLVFYIILSPMALLLRIFGRKNPVALEWSRAQPSYRKESVPQNRDRMKEMF